MEHDASRPAGEELLANLGWVRRLALAIVRDSSAADDVTQEVARVALERDEPVPASGLRAWLGAVTRRLALDRTRSEAARHARERSVARPEGDGSAAEVVERSARQQRAARAVMELAEPYRSTILYRYLDEMPVAEVARRTNVNEVTARKRLSRGLEMLRARLDTEFGTGTRNWAIALLAPGKVTLMMSTKWIAAGAAAVIVGLGWWGWNVAHSSESSTEAPAMAVDLDLDQSPVVKKDTGTTASVAQEVAALTDAKRESATPPPAEPDATILHVRVLDRVGSAVTAGRVETWWTVSTEPTNSMTRKFVEAEIHAEVTDIVLPATAASASVRASVSGHLGTQEQIVRKLRQDAIGRVEREVVLHLDEPLEPPSLQGVVTIDGTRRVPRALTIAENKAGHSLASGRINAVDATYALPHATVGAMLLVTSDETILQEIQLSEEIVASGMLDLKLSNGKTLVLTLLDRDDGHPLANEDFLVETGLNLSGNIWTGDARSHRTDDIGKCEVRGLTNEESVSIGPASEPEKRAVIFNDNWGEEHLGKFDPTMEMPMPAQAWWHQRIRTDEASISVTLRVKHVAEGARIFGTVPADLLQGQGDVSTRIRVAAKELAQEGPSAGDGFDVSLDAQGRWTIPVQWPSRYLVWIEAVKPRKPLSQQVTVEVAAAGPRGPIELPLTSTKTETNFELQIENVPDGGRTEVAVFAEKTKSHSEGVECKDGRCTHRMRIDGPSQVTLTWSRGDMRETQIRRSFKVDPARQSSLRIDMGGDQLRAVEFVAQGAAIPAYALLGFGKLDEGGRMTHESGSTTLIDGRAQGQVSLSPGRWFFECFDPKRDFNVTGILEVKAGSETLHIARDVVVIERSQIPHGIELTEMDGVKLDGLERPMRYTELGPSGKVILNATARYRALP